MRRYTACVMAGACVIGRVSNAITPGEPFNIDRILGASYNTRSVLETLIALTPEFYYYCPGRIKDISGITSIEHRHKHLIWLPDEPHTNLQWKDSRRISRCCSGS